MPRLAISLHPDQVSQKKKKLLHVLLGRSTTGYTQVGYTAPQRPREV